MPPHAKLFTLREIGFFGKQKQKPNSGGGFDEEGPYTALWILQTPHYGIGVSAAVSSRAARIGNRSDG